MAKQRGIFPFTGTIGDVVGQKSRGGYNLRLWVHPTNPQTALQQSYRLMVEQTSKRWGTLGSALQKMWQDWAQIINTKTPGQPGSGKSNTYVGYTLFMMTQLECLHTNQSVYDVPPLGVPYDSFNVTAWTSVAQFAPADSFVNLTFAFLNNVVLFSNFGGIEAAVALISSGRAYENLSWRECDKYPMLVGDISPKTWKFNTFIDPLVFPVDIVLKFHGHDQAGLMGGVSSYFPLSLV